MFLCRLKLFQLAWNFIPPLKFQNCPPSSLQLNRVTKLAVIYHRTEHRIASIFIAIVNLSNCELFFLNLLKTFRDVYQLINFNNTSYGARGEKWQTSSRKFIDKCHGTLKVSLHRASGI
jgi:hypothetical protein